MLNSINLHSIKIISKLFYPLKKVPFLPIIVDEQLKIITLFLKPVVFSKMIELNKWIKSLEKVKTKYHKLGGIEFTLNNNEICHIHGDGLVDVKLNDFLKKKFIEYKNIEPHHVYPSSNMISYQISKNDDLSLIKKVIEKAYELSYH